MLKTLALMAAMFVGYVTPIGGAASKGFGYGLPQVTKITLDQTRYKLAYDFNKDNIPEMVETYAGDKLEATEFDFDQDGKPDRTDRIAPIVAPTTTEPLPPQSQTSP